MKPTIIVSGLARCGSSLTMQMLHAAGLKCAGEYPGFEPPWTCPSRADHGLVKAKQIARYDAVKILEPHMIKIDPEANVAVIWLDRNPFEQAKSQLKFFATLNPNVRLVDDALDRMLRGVREDRDRALAALPKCPMLMLNFEELVGMPFTAASQILQFLFNHQRTVRLGDLAGEIIMRGPECQPDLGIELQLVNR